MDYCQPLSLMNTPPTAGKSVPEAVVDLSEARFSHRFFRSIEAAGRDWDLAAPPCDIFLQKPYLSVLEKAPPEGMRFGYLVFYQQDMPIGVALCQIKYFKADENIQEISAEPEKAQCFFNGLANWFKKQVAGWVAADILICGNLVLTGEHGFYFDGRYISPAVAAGLLETALVDTVKLLGQSGIKTPVILVKDVSPAQTTVEQVLESANFARFTVQPNMVMELPFPTFEAYLAAMSTKYRTRAKRAFKKLGNLQKQELSLADIRREQPLLHSLYRDIARNAGFNMVDLNENYLYVLKETLGDAFQVFGYYLEGRLCAYYTVIRNHDELEAHFLGYDKSLNHERQLYLNMLYEMVRMGIETGCKRLVFARTALEIKSSVGAVACDLHCYLRHQNSFTNRFAESLLDYFNPVEIWQPRHPFVHDNNHAEHDG